LDSTNTEKNTNGKTIEEKAYKKMAKKFWIAVALSLPVFFIAMSEFFISSSSA
jgi:hypothetical protein